MRIGEAISSEKDKILSFCKDTFSWGDYIPQVWDYWITEGNLLVAHEKDEPVGITHISFSTKNKQTWIEGIRVHPNFRRRGIAKKLILEAESLAQKNNCTKSYMLIEENNSNSLKLAENLNYKIYETWFFYSVCPKKRESELKIKFANFKEKKPFLLFNSSNMYVKSWRWISLDTEVISELCKKNQIVYNDSNDSTSLAIFSDSEHFDQTLIVTIIQGNHDGIRDIFYYIQNLAFQKNYKRIQILTKLNSLPNLEGLERKLVFYLMKKQV